MRISHDRKDPGYFEAIQILPAKVVVEGHPEAICVTADSTKGEALIFVRNEDGVFRADPETGNIKRKLVKAKVTITIQCPKHKSYRAIRRPQCECAKCWAMWEFLSKN